MGKVLCDICGERPATARVTVIQNGRRETYDVCDADYRRLRRQERFLSPFESLFAGGFLDDLFGDLADLDLFPGFGGMERRRRREAADIERLLSDHARELVQQAARTAVDFGRREVDTEHLLYALADSDVVQEILKYFKIQAADIKGYIDHNAPKEEAARREAPEEISVSPRVKTALEHAMAAARDLGHGYVGPEHLLIGLAAEQDGLAGDLLRKYGLTPEALRRKTEQAVGRGPRAAAGGRSTTPHLDKYSRDLTRLAREGKLDPVIGRSEEIETTIEILSRRTKNNPVLIGEPGVGKTAIVEGLAQRIVKGEVPEILRNKRVVEFSINSLVAGTKYRGEFEERIKQVLDEVAAHKDELILFIDELHTIMGAGAAGGEGGLDVANVLKPALARGELHLIGATTLNEYQKHIEKDAALERRFQPVYVDEPTVEETVEILRGLRDKYEAHHKVKITDEAIRAAAELSDRYITGRHLPDKAIDLIDQAASRVRILSTSRSEEMKGLQEEIARLEREREAAAARRQYDEAKRLDGLVQERQKELEAATDAWKKEKGVRSPEVTREQIAAIISRLTGIPVTELTAEERERLLHMEEKLHQRVIGQEEAVRAVSDAVRLARAGLKEGHRPIATFLFLGPTGVGKTELAKALAWVVFGDEDAMVRLDMSEYMERHTVSRLIGAPPGYVGYEEGGQLTERVRRRPYSVVLLDEIEKAHPDVHNILLQVFDDGRLTDGKGRVVDFSNTILIATSNLGADLIQAQLALPEAARKSYQALKEDLMGILRRHFRPEFLNRIDEIIVFHALDREQIRRIVRLQLDRVAATARGQGVALEFDDSLVDHLAEVGYQPEFGARELKRRIKAEVETRLAREMLAGNVAAGDTVRLRYDREAGVVVEKAMPSAVEG